MAGSAGLAWYVWRGPGTERVEAVAGGRDAAAGPVGVAAGVERDGERRADAETLIRNSAPAWREVLASGDLAGITARLREAGFAPGVVRAIVGRLVEERFASRDPSGRVPYWKRESYDKAVVAERQALGREKEELLKSLLGEDARVSAGMDPATRLRRYGTTSGEKVDGIAQIERDYSELMAGTFAEGLPRTAEGLRSYEEQRALLEQEKQKDLAALLTPEELEQYNLRQSNTAQRVMSATRDLELTEGEYAALYDLQKDFEAASPTTQLLTSETMATRRVAQERMDEQARAILGEDRFYDFLKRSDSGYARLSEFTGQYPAIAPATTYALLKVQNQFQSEMTELGRNREMPAAERAQAMVTLMTATEQQVTALIGPEATAAYKKTSVGRMLKGSGPGK